MGVGSEQEVAAVRAARAGDPEAWDTLLRRYQLPLYTYVREMISDEQASLDLVQETFVRGVRHLAQLRDEARFGAWLFGIAHQQCLGHWRRARPDVVPWDEQAGVLPDPGEDPGDCLVRKEEEEHVMTCLGGLSEAHRAVLLLHVLEGFPLRDIASITGVGVGTVKSRLHYAKHALRQRLEHTQ